MHPIKKKLILGVCVLIESLFIFGIGVVPVHAEARHQGMIMQDTAWSADENPHLLESDVIVRDGVTLSILPGTVVGIAPESDTGDIGFNPALYVNGGRLAVQGSAKNRISIDGVSGVFIQSGQTENGRADISYADFSGGSRISFEDSYGTISSSTIRGARIAVKSKDSIVSVWGSRIDHNSMGINIEPHQVFQVRGLSGSGTGGEGNALAFAPDIHESSSFSISNSTIQDNLEQAISNESDLSVNAVDNWWGSVLGPSQTGMNSIRGDVAYTPWLIAEPDLDHEPIAAPPCCSSILFIPGMEGSRLYSGTNQLWEPNRNADVKKLALNAFGSSTDPSIYSGGPIGKALGFVEVYGKFMGFLGGLVTDGKVNEWRAFGYDWRKPISEVVAGREKKATTTESLIEVAEGLASRSRTGRINIIAHSNGGLVAKYLVKSLTEMGKGELVDAVISVAVPYLGTPQALSSLLDGQSFLGGLVMSRATSKAMGLNMPSAYSLLPSREFFSRVFTPTVAFASTTHGVSSSAEQDAFISGKGGNALLLRAAYLVHDLIDVWMWPSKIRNWSIAGWNKDTVNTVSIKGNNKKDITTVAGDGTVVAPSAYGSGGRVVSLDLKKQSELDGTDISHMNILESSTTKAAISRIVTGDSDNDAKILEDIAKLPGVTIDEIDWRKIMHDEEYGRKQIYVTTHSPVKLHVYDSQGRHTGEIPLSPEILDYRDEGDPDGAGVEEGFYTMKEEKIPDSSYDVLGCKDEKGLDCDTQIILPDNGETYTAVVEGTSIGTFTLALERVRATSTIETLEWSGVPVTGFSVATTTFKSNASFTAKRTDLASSTSQLKLDIDGDGSSDATMKPGKTKDSGARLELIKKYMSLFKTRSGHARFKDLGRIERKLVRECVEAFVKKFGRS